MMAEKHTGTQIYESIPQTEDEPAHLGSIPQTEDEPVRLESAPQTEDEPSGTNIRARSEKAEKNEKKRLNKPSGKKADRNQIGRVFRNLAPYLTALFLLSVIAFGIVVAVHSSVEAYCEKVYQENEEYFSYE